MSKQPDLREFIFKKRKSQESSDNSNASVSPTSNSSQYQENAMNMSGSNNSIVPLEDNELVYDSIELLPHDPEKKNRHNGLSSKSTRCDRGGLCQFSVSWFERWDWLEYSIEKNAAFCFVCYLFKNEDQINVGGDAFVNEGFKS
ncbi:hypothetical protein OROMI_013178 [Orobanche minor]